MKKTLILLLGLPWADMGPMVRIGGAAMLTGLPPVAPASLTFGPTSSGIGLALRF